MARSDSAKGAFAHLARPGAQIAVRVTPNAARDGVSLADQGLHIRTTAPPEGGKATADVQKQLARALGVPKTRLTLLRGAASRDKVFTVLP